MHYRRTGVAGATYFRRPKLPTGIVWPSAEAPLWVLRARACAMDTATEVTDLAMKLAGGAGFSRQLPIERLFRDARAGWVMAPTVDHLHDFLGKALSGLPLF